MWFLIVGVNGRSGRKCEVGLEIVFSWKIWAEQNKRNHLADLAFILLGVWILRDSKAPLCRCAFFGQSIFPLFKTHVMNHIYKRRGAIKSMSYIRRKGRREEGEKGRGRRGGKEGRRREKGAEGRERKGGRGNEEERLN